MDMITEDYVSFETAELLKKKGFDEKCISVYNDGELQLVSSLDIFCGEGYGEQILTYTNSECEWSPIMISAPTLQMAMKWLREVYHIIISVRLFNSAEHFYLGEPNQFTVDIATTTMSSQKGHIRAFYSTYEEACESAIKYCLENLI